MRKAYRISFADAICVQVNAERVLASAQGGHMEPSRNDMGSHLRIEHSGHCGKRQLEVNRWHVTGFQIFLATVCHILPLQELQR